MKAYCVDVGKLPFRMGARVNSTIFDQNAAEQVKKKEVVRPLVHGSC